MGLAALAGVGALAAPAAPPGSLLIDDFKDAGRWQATASDQVQSRLSQDAQGALCLHYNFYDSEAAHICATYNRHW